MKLAGLDHIVLRAVDPERLIRFYCDVLGCTVERELGDGVGLTQLRAGNALIDIVAVEDELGRAGGGAPDRQAQNMDHFCVLLQEFDEGSLREHLAGFGIDAGKVSSRYGATGFGPSIYIQDPEGNTVELKGPPEPA